MASLPRAVSVGKAAVEGTGAQGGIFGVKQGASVTGLSQRLTHCSRWSLSSQLHLRIAIPVIGCHLSWPCRGGAACSAAVCRVAVSVTVTSSQDLTVVEVPGRLSRLW